MDTDQARLLRLNADAVLSADGSAREAVPDSHGKGILALKDHAPGASAAEAAAALYDCGVRRLLLEGGHDAAVPFLAAGLVDRVVAYLPHGSSSPRPAAELPWPLLPGPLRSVTSAQNDAPPGGDGDRLTGKMSWP